MVRLATPIDIGLSLKIGVKWLFTAVIKMKMGPKWQIGGEEVDTHPTCG